MLYNMLFIRFFWYKEYNFACIFALWGRQITISKRSSDAIFKNIFSSLCVIENDKICLLRGFVVRVKHSECTAKTVYYTQVAVLSRVSQKSDV